MDKGLHEYLYIIYSSLHKKKCMYMYVYRCIHVVIINIIKRTVKELNVYKLNNNCIYIYIYEFMYKNILLYVCQ